MLVNNFHFQPHAIPGPKSPKLSDSRSSSAAGQAASGRSEDLTSGVDAVRPLLDRLQSIPEVRSEEVENAKARLAQGEYSTSQAAVETAAAFFNLS
ncbi:MAG: hypothetical protein R3C49_08080 [Planctomycetaceae bacterium]